MLESFGFKRWDSFECVIKYKDNKNDVLISVYVDDLVNLTADSCAISWMKSELKSLFNLSDFGELKTIFKVRLSIK